MKRYSRLSLASIITIGSVAIAIVLMTRGIVIGVLPGQIVINEFLADPPPDISGDANGDGVRDSFQDEFVELVNVAPVEVWLDGCTLSDSYGVRYTFPSSISIQSGHSAVIFGGGEPATELWNRTVILTAGDGLGLNNSGDTIILTDPAGTDIAIHIYGSEGANNQSLTRNPDLSETWDLHSTAHPREQLFSPGFKLNGEEFGVNELPATADAGDDQVVYDEAYLDGSNSIPAGEIVSYEWQLLHREDASNNRSVSGMTPVVTGLKPGFYDVILTITDIYSQTNSDEMTLAALGQKGDLDFDGDVDAEDLTEFAEVFGSVY